MSTGLGFAIDGLYACGWWPNNEDQCLQDTDGRWYPGESMIIESFAQSACHPKVRKMDQSHAVEVIWHSPKRGNQSVLGRSKHEALLLAFTSMYTESQIESSTIL